MALVGQVEDKLATDARSRLATLRFLLLRPIEATIAAAAFGVGTLQRPDGDYWWHIAVGRYLVQERRWPSPDPFSFTVSDQSWTVHEWLLEIVMYLLHDTFGPWGTTVFFALCFATAMVIAFVALRAASFSAIRATEITV